MKFASYFHSKTVTRFAAASLGTALVALTLVLVVTPSALAASDPVLGTAGTFGVLSSTFTNSGTTTINGDLGYTTGTTPTVHGTTYVPPAAQTGVDELSALSTLNSEAPCDILSNLDLSSGPDHSAGQASGTYLPGVYCVQIAGGVTTGTGITLVGGGAYVFLINGALNSVADVPGVTLSDGASACDVWWAPTGATTLGAQTTLGATPNFVGTDIDPAGINVGDNENWSGRALSYQSTVATDNDIISVPTCNAPLTTPSATTTCTLTSSQNPATLGQSVTFTAVVTGANPTGSVTFLGNSALLATSTFSASGQATYTTTSLAAGSDIIVVSYGGDGANNACQSAAFIETVDQVVTTTTVVATTPTTIAVTTPTTTPAALSASTIKRSVTKKAKPKATTRSGITTTTSAPSITSVPTAPASPITSTLVAVTG